jgi:Tol biopolymer transport system component
VERWSSIEALLGEALERPAGERAAWLDARCPDPAIRAEVEALLRASEREGVLDRVAAAIGGAPGAVRLEPGTALGPYVVVGPIGAGGMGSVYAARDTRLGREVAIKVPAPHLVNDEAARMRLEREARSIAALSHPNIVALFDIGMHQGVVYLVTERLAGRTLRARLLDGPLPERELLDFGAQVARGLGAAHARGIIHRDLKPENLFITGDGVVKILDFGIARSQGAGSSAAPLTAPETFIGTMDYMSPEQLAGDAVDERSDLFSLGVVLYEAATGRRPFEGATRAAVASAILSTTPPAPDPSAVRPAVAQVIARCLAKAPKDRYQSAADLGFTLEVVGTSAVAAAHGVPAPRAAASPWSRRAVLGLGAVALADGLWRLSDRFAPFSSPVALRQITFGHGHVGSARFAADGETIVYGASWQGEEYRLFTTPADGSDSRALADVPPADLLALSNADLLAISLARQPGTGFSPDGTLAVVPLAGGLPRARFERVVAADWSPGGELAAIVRRSGPVARLEFPVGTTIHESPVILSPRVSPDGRYLCFFAGYGNLLIAPPGGPARTLADGLGRAGDCAWSRDGREVWVAGSSRALTASQSGGTTHTVLQAIDLSGRRRAVTPFAGYAKVMDVAPDGRVLLALGVLRHSAHAARRGQTARDLSIYDGTRVVQVRADGEEVLLFDNGLPAGADSSFRRSIAGSPATRLSTAGPLAITADGSLLAAVDAPVPGSTLFYGGLRLVPTGPGSPRQVTLPIAFKQAYSSGVASRAFDHDARSAEFSADGRRLLLPYGQAPGEPPRVYVHDLDTGQTIPVTPERVTGPAVLSPDGRFVVVKQDESLVEYPVEEGPFRALPGGAEPGMPAGWSRDGRTLHVVEYEGLAARLVARDVETGARRTIDEIRVPDPAGVLRFDVFVARDGEAWAYSLTRSASNLFVVDGLR